MDQSPPVQARLSNPDPSAARHATPELFPSTLWTVVAQAADTAPARAQAALAGLCER